MKPEMTSLVLASTFTGLLWMPYVLNRMVVRGIASTVVTHVMPVIELHRLSDGELALLIVRCAHVDHRRPTSD